MEDFSSTALAPVPAWSLGDFSELIWCLNSPSPLIYIYCLGFVHWWTAEFQEKSPMQSYKSGVLVLKFRPCLPLKFQ